MRHNKQTNPNIEQKNIVNRWDWNDTGHTDSAWAKKYYRKLRRKLIKRKFSTREKLGSCKICNKCKICK